MSFAPQTEPVARRPRLGQTVRMAQIVHSALLGAIVLYVGITVVFAPPVKPVAAPVIGALAAVAISGAMMALILRSRLVGPAEEVLRNHPEDDSALGQWRAGQIVSLALAEAVVLYGLVLKFLGAEWRVAGTFFAAGALLMVIFTPRHP